LVNWIFENLQIPKTLKSGIACPILKKGKPAHDPNSYRKITITNLIGKGKALSNSGMLVGVARSLK
jgi:hypothetical protein